MKESFKTALQKSFKFSYFAPLLVFMFIFKLWPFVQILIISFKEDYNFLTKDYSGLGIENYVTVLTDEYFIQAISNTFLYTVAVIVLTNLIAIPVAWYLYQIKRFSAVFQTAIFLPFVTSNIAIGMAWRIIFNEKGVLNSFLNLFGISSIHWLADSAMSLTTLTIYGVWSNIPFTVLLYLSFLLSFDKTLLVAASVDGARESKTFLKIVLPVMMPTIMMTTVLNGISTWLEINALFPLFSGTPGPYYDLYTVVYYIYSKMQKGPYSFGIVCAASTLLFLCIAGFMSLRALVRLSGSKVLKERKRRI
jgi:multiple sugar transport system permease protein